MRRVLLWAALLVAAGMMVPPHAVAQEVSIFILGPEVVGIGSNVTYNVTVTGGPAEMGGKYNVTAFLEGPQDPSATPSHSHPYVNESTDNAFSVDVVTPSSPQTMDLVVNVSSQSTDGSEKKWAQTSLSITVVRPITISALVTNGSNVTLEGIDVRFYVDGELVGASVEDFPAMDSKTVRVEWVVERLDPGSHEATVEVDLDGDGVLDPAKGEVVGARIFYRESGGPHYTLLIVTLLIVLAGLVAIILVRRSLRPR